MGFDIVIIGAGPAGSIAAHELASSGARVAILDGSHPREKACGGGVTARAIPFVSEAIRPLGQIVSTAIFGGAGRRTEVPLPDGALCVFPRDAMDGALLARAVDRGAVHVGSRVTRIERTDRGWAVRSGDRTIDAPWLLGADGASGIVRKQVFRPFSRDQISIAAGSFVDGIEASQIAIEFLAEPPGYLWSFPRPDHVAVGACAQADRTSTAELQAIVDRWLDGVPWARGLPRRRYAWPIPSLSARDLDREAPAGDGWMLLGDAAGLVDPITREGIYFAMESGALAARAMAGANPAAAYASSVRDEIHGELKRAARLRGMFFHPRFASLLIHALTRSAAIREIMIDLIAGRQPYKGLRRRLLGTGEIGLMFRLLLNIEH